MIERLGRMVEEAIAHIGGVELQDITPYMVEVCGSPPYYVVSNCGANSAEQIRKVYPLSQYDIGSRRLYVYLPELK